MALKPGTSVRGYSVQIGEGGDLLEWTLSRCSHKRKKNRSKAYGAKRKLVWCDICDLEMVIPHPCKKRARQSGKNDCKEDEWN